MSILAQWAEHGIEEGDYATFAGFEAAIRDHHELLAIAYDRMDIGEQVQLFGFVVGLIGEEDG